MFKTANKEELRKQQKVIREGPKFHISTTDSSIFAIEKQLHVRLKPQI